MKSTSRALTLVVSADDPTLVDRLRASAWWGVSATVFAPPTDMRAARLARAAGATLGSIWPDTSRPVVRVDQPLSPEEWTQLAGHTAVVPASVSIDSSGSVALLRRVNHATAEVADGDGLALDAWDGATVDALIQAGWGLPSLTPVATSRRLDGLRVIHVTSVHRPDDGRIFQKEVLALRAAGADATVLGLTTRASRKERIGAGRQLMREAARRGADIYHVHDPELLPAAAALTRSTGRPVIYDAHEYLGQTTRTKPWIPAALRVPVAVTVERMERVLAARLAAVVTVTEDMAVDFAAAGIPAVSVANYAPRERFPEPGPPPDPLTVTYVGALDRSRGRDLMRAAFSLVDVPGARLVLAGPGDPGDLPPGAEHRGPLPYDAVPGVLGDASVIWMPLQRSPNNDRGRLTKVLEAMGAGRPMVVSNLTRTAAIVRQAGCGIVVEHNDPAAHAAALTELLRNPDRAAQMGAAGRQAFVDRMTFEGEAAKLVDLYAQIADEWGQA